MSAAPQGRRAGGPTRPHVVVRLDQAACELPRRARGPRCRTGRAPLPPAPFTRLVGPVGIRSRADLAPPPAYGGPDGIDGRQPVAGVLGTRRARNATRSRRCRRARGTDARRNHGTALAVAADPE